MHSLEKACNKTKMIDKLASWWAKPWPSRAWLSTLWAKKQISRALIITKLRKADYKNQFKNLFMIGRIVIMITATIS